MDYNYERKLEVNEWVIVMRWFYMVAVFLVGILGNSLISLFEIKFSFYYIGGLLLIFLAVNSLFYRTLENIKKNKSDEKLKLLSIWQIVIELVLFSGMMYLVGDNSLTQVFFFLPIISSSLIFGIRGAVITAVASALLANLFMVYEYFDIILDYFYGKGIFNGFSAYEIRYATIDLIKTIVTSNFYLIIAVVSGYSSKLLLKREKRIISDVDRLNREKASWQEEVKKKSQDATLMEKHDAVITGINKQLNQKIAELEKSEKSLMRAFSDLKTARENMAREQRKTGAIISNFVDPIILIDKNSRLALFNPASKNIFGLLESDLGKSISGDNNYSMENFKFLIERDYEVKGAKEIKAGAENEEELTINFAQQDLTYKVITEKVTDKNGETLGVMKIFYNLTREKMIDKMKSEFISIAAHQLRTPLSAIKWVVKMVLDGDAGKLNKEQEKLLSKGYASNERIINLVNDMLNVSRIEEGRFGYNFQKEDYSKTLKRHIDDLEPIIKKKSIKLKLEAPEKMLSVFMDKSKMDLVFQNLLENAVKYTPEFGKILIAIEKGDKFLKTRIKDNGVGIPEKDQPKLFSKFFRAENVMRMQTEGSGLGLFIVKNIIKKHGGEISFKSEEGKGTEFVFTIPINE